MGMGHQVPVADGVLEGLVDSVPDGEGDGVDDSVPLGLCVELGEVDSVALGL
jgi:hypothetical protein